MELHCDNSSDDETIVPSGLEPTIHHEENTPASFQSQPLEDGKSKYFVLNREVS